MSSDRMFPLAIAVAAWGFACQKSGTVEPADRSTAAAQHSAGQPDAGPSAAESDGERSSPDPDRQHDGEVEEPEELPEAGPMADDTASADDHAAEEGVPPGIPGGVVAGALGGAAARSRSSGPARPGGAVPIRTVMSRAIYSPDPPIEKIAETKAASAGKPVTTTIDFCVDPKGWASKVKVKMSSGDEELDGICRDTVKKWRFKPFLFEGVATDVCTNAVFQINFN